MFKLIDKKIITVLLTKKFANPNLCIIFFTDYNSISKFLNRMLGMEVICQNTLFKYFSDTLAAIILEAKRSGRWDMGILGRYSLGKYFLVKLCKTATLKKTKNWFIT